MTRLRAIFMGSPDFAVPTLEALAARHEVVLAVSQPDRPAGRGQKLQRPAVALRAEALGIPVEQPAKIKDPALHERLAALGADVIVVVAYGRILPPAILSLPRLGCINVHASLLPRHRGAAPIQWALIHGDAETGVSIMLMDEGLDTGPVLDQRRIPITEEDTAATLFERLSRLGAEALVEALDRYAAGELQARPQSSLPGEPTLALRLTKADGLLDFTWTAEEVACRARGVDPWPGAMASWRGEIVKLFRPAIVPAPPGAAPGSVLPQSVELGKLVVACGDRQAVAFAELQRPGKRRMAVADAILGLRIQPGEQLERAVLPAADEG